MWTSHNEWQNPKEVFTVSLYYQYVNTCLVQKRIRDGHLFISILLKTTTAFWKSELCTIKRRSCMQLYVDSSSHFIFKVFNRPRIWFYGRHCKMYSLVAAGAANSHVVLIDFVHSSYNSSMITLGRGRRQQNTCSTIFVLSESQGYSRSTPKKEWAKPPYCEVFSEKRFTSSSEARGESGTS